MTDTLEQIEARRAARKAESAAAAAAQAVLDLGAIDALEVEHGDENVAIVLVPYTPGSVTRVAVVTPSEAFLKRWRSAIRPRKADGELHGDAVVASEQLGRSCLAYPPQGEIRDQLLKSRPGLAAQCGAVALELSQGKAESEGKA